MFNKISKLILVALSVLIIILFFHKAPAQKKYMLETYESGINSINNENYVEAQEILSELGDYKDSLEQIEKAQSLEQQKIIYDSAVQLFNNEDYKNAIDSFTQIIDFKDSKDYIEEATKLMEQKNANESLYSEAYNYYESKDYISAIQIFSKLNDYKDSEEILQECRLELAKLQQATTISAGIRSSVGMIRYGKVYLAGDDEYSWESELENWNNIISISVKGNFVVGLKEDGTVVMAGKVPEYYVGTKTWNDVIAISTGQQYIIGLRADGTLVAQGHNGDHQVDIDDWSDVVAISTGWRHTVGLDSKGEIHIAGLGKDGQLAEINKNKNDWTDIVAIAAGGGSGDPGTKAFTVALKKDGTVVTTLTGKIAEEVNNWKDIIAISAGDSHIVGITSDYKVVTTQTGTSADEIKAWTDIVAVSAGYNFTLGLTSSGSVKAIGFNKNGQIDVDTWDKITNYKEEWKSIFDEELRWNGIK